MCSIDRSDPDIEVFHKNLWKDVSEECCTFCKIRFTKKKILRFNEDCFICKMWFYDEYELNNHRREHWCFNFVERTYFSK